MRLYMIGIFLSLALMGCSNTYYNAMEKLGFHKRDLLVDRVSDAKEAQKDGAQQFESALEQFKSVVNVEGGELEKIYDSLNRHYKDSLKSANDIRGRINDIESVAQALFNEWRDEIKLYSSASLRRDSEQKLKATKVKYTQLVKALEKSESLLQPVLDAMQDQVLYLKHNLNARAISSIKNEVPKIDRDVDKLITAMRNAMAEADVFIEGLNNN